MGSWTAFLLTYLLGGLTFIPLLIVAVLAHAHRTFPYRDDVDPDPNAEGGDHSIVQPGDDIAALDKAKSDHRKTENARDRPRSAQENETAAAYFAVCREYVPMGINAKPIERSTPVGSTTVAAPSQSVYQTMYRSIFDRKPPPGPIDTKGAQNQRPKNAGNVFFVVLRFVACPLPSLGADFADHNSTSPRHGHLMLFDDEEQIEVRHVVSLAYHDISIYSGGDVTPEGELFIKKNALCLTRRWDGPDQGPDSQLSKPFYLFSEDSSAKEDFYFALLRNQEQYFEMDKKAPRPKQFDVKNIITLVQKLHSSDDHQPTRWLNAMIGRVFLGLYQTADLEHFIREKLTKKISRVKKPSFLTNITIRKIETGESAPVLLHPRHKDLNVDGECSMEADVKYSGNFRLEVSATARLDLGPRFKVREVNLVLAVCLRKLEGHVFFKIKPPPSNRVWFSFQNMPKMEMTIEPIVSSRQITYTVILRQIENRIKEVIAETLVQPYWDDVPFFHTEHKKWRGGIWEGDDAIVGSTVEDNVAQEGDVDTVERLEEAADAQGELRPIEKSYSAPLADNVPPTGLFGRKLAGKASTSARAGSATTGADPKNSTASLPRTFRSPSVSGSSDPVVGTDSTHASVFKPSSSPPDNASSMMAALSARSSPAQTPIDSPARPASVAKEMSQPFSVGQEMTEADEDTEETSVGASRRDTASSSDSTTRNEERDPDVSSISLKGSLRSNTGSLKSNASSITKGLFSRKENNENSGSGSGPGPNGPTNGDFPPKRNNTFSAVANAATQARQWGWNAIQKRREGTANSGDPESRVDLNQPMGRGRPLPPPGTPLPRPDRNSKVTTIPALPPKRKPVPPPSLPERPTSGDSSNGRAESESAPPPPLPNRRRRESSQTTHPDDEGENMLVVEAPLDSEPTTPMDRGDKEPSYAQAWAAADEGGRSNTFSNGSRVRSKKNEDLKSPTVIEGSRQDSLVEQSARELPDEGQLNRRSGDADESPGLETPVEARPSRDIPDEEDDDDLSGWLEETETDEGGDDLSDPAAGGDRKYALKMD